METGPTSVSVVRRLENDGGGSPHFRCGDRSARSSRAHLAEPNDADGGWLDNARKLAIACFNPDPTSNTYSTVSIGFYDGWRFEAGYSQFAGVIEPSPVGVIGLRKMGSGRPGRSEERRV